MDTALLVAVGVLAALTVGNLLLLLGVVRRLREHETRLAGDDAAPEVMAPPGHQVGDVLDGATLVGFLSPSCDACHERLPEFRKAAADHPGAVLAVVVRDGADPDMLVAELDGSATVVVEEPQGRLATAFAVRGFPAFALVGPDGTVLASGYDVPR